MVNFLITLVIISILNIFLLCVSIYIHENKKGTKIWKFIDRYIITETDQDI
jgi:hypothetical protein